MSIKQIQERFRWDLLAGKANLREGQELTKELLLGRDKKRLVKWLEDEYGIEDGETALDHPETLPDGDLPYDVQVDIIYRAKEQDENALRLLFYRSWDIIRGHFPRSLGSSSFYRHKKLSGALDGGAMDWLATAFNAMTGGVNSENWDFTRSPVYTFDVAKAGDNPLKMFSSWMTKTIWNTVNYEIKHHLRGGLTGHGIDTGKHSGVKVMSLDTTLSNDESGKTFGDMVGDDRISVEDDYIASDNEYKFLSAWKEMCSDSEFYEVNDNTSPADVARFVLEITRAAVESVANGGESSKTTKKDMISELGTTTYGLNKAVAKFNALQDIYEVYDFVDNVRTIGAEPLLGYIKK